MNQHSQSLITSTPEPRYITEARTAFVGDLAPLSPHEIVAAGLKTASEWCEYLRAAREMYPNQVCVGHQTKLKDFEKKKLAPKLGRKPGRPRVFENTGPA